MKIELTKLHFQKEADHDEDVVSIFTRMGIHRPGVPMGHKCMVAEVHCGDTTDPDDSAYQIAQLFIAAPALLAVCEFLAEAFPEDGIVEMDAADFKDRAGLTMAAVCKAKAAIAAVEG